MPARKQVEMLPRHPGPRTGDAPKNLLQVIRGIQRDVASLAARVRPTELLVARADVTTGVVTTSSVFAQAFVTKVVRGAGHSVVVEVLAGTGAGSVVEARLTCPDLRLTGAAVASAAGGTEQEIKVALQIPDAWLVGDGHRVYVEARRVSGTDSCTTRVIRAIHR